MIVLVFSYVNDRADKFLLIDLGDVKLTFARVTEAIVIWDEELGYDIMRNTKGKRFELIYFPIMKLDAP